MLREVRRVQANCIGRLCPSAWAAKALRAVPQHCAQKAALDSSHRSWGSVLYSYCCIFGFGMMEESLRTTTPGHLRKTVGWLGNTIRRLSLSMVLSVVFHITLIALVILALIHMRETRPQESPGITVSLVDLGQLQDDPARPASTQNNRQEGMEPGTPSLAEEAKKQMQRETEQKFKNTSERISADAERVAKEDVDRILAEREADYARKHAEMKAKVAGLLKASATEASEAAKQATKQAAEIREALAGSFYGVAPGKARRIIYVVDHSSSMQDAFSEVQLELKRTVSSMTEKKFFDVIFFTHNDYQEMPARALLRASKAHKNAAHRFIDSIKPGGGTDPTRALDRAFKLRPDLIYLLTDGQFDSSIVDHIRALNKKGRVTVNTICFRSRVGEDILRLIAAQNSGRYRFVK